MLSLRRVWNSIEVSVILNSLVGQKRKQLINRLNVHFGEDIVILSAAGFATVLIFKRKAQSVMFVGNTLNV